MPRYALFAPSAVAGRPTGRGGDRRGAIPWETPDGGSRRRGEDLPEVPPLPPEPKPKEANNKHERIKE